MPRVFVRLHAAHALPQVYLTLLCQFGVLHPCCCSCCRLCSLCNHSGCRQCPGHHGRLLKLRQVRRHFCSRWVVLEQRSACERELRNWPQASITRPRILPQHNKSIIKLLSFSTVVCLCDLNQTGVDIYSSVIPNSYARWSGTSMA